MTDEGLLFTINYVNGKGEERQYEFAIRKTDLLLSAMQHFGDDAAQEYEVNFEGETEIETGFDN